MLNSTQCILYNSPSRSPLLECTASIPKAGTRRISRAMLARAISTYTTPISRAGTRHIRGALLTPPLPLGSIVRRRAISSVRRRRGTQLIRGRFNYRLWCPHLGAPQLLNPRARRTIAQEERHNQKEGDPKPETESQLQRQLTFRGVTNAVAGVEFAACDARIVRGDGAAVEVAGDTFDYEP